MSDTICRAYRPDHLWAWPPRPQPLEHDSPAAVSEPLPCGVSNRCACCTGRRACRSASVCCFIAAPARREETETCEHQDQPRGKESDESLRSPCPAVLPTSFARPSLAEALRWLRIIGRIGVKLGYSIDDPAAGEWLQVCLQSVGNLLGIDLPVIHVERKGFQIFFSLRRIFDGCLRPP